MSDSKRISVHTEFQSELLVDWFEYIRKIMEANKWPISSWDFLFENELATRTTYTVLWRLINNEGPPDEKP